MKFKAIVEATHENQPLNIDISIEFEKDEYIQVLKTMPAIVKDIKKELKKGKA